MTAAYSGKFPNETEIYKMQTNTFSLTSLPVGKRCRVAALLSPTVNSAGACSTWD